MSVEVVLAAYLSLHSAKQSYWDSVLDPGFGCSHFLLVMGNPSLRVKIKNGEKIQILYLYSHWRGPQECTVCTVDPCISVHFPRTN